MPDNNSTITETELKGVFTINRNIISDERGFFREVFRKDGLEKELGVTIDLVQANHSRSQKGVLRGIHRAAWSKLIYVPNGVVQSVIVDLREDSESFGKYLSVTLGEENKVALFIPPYFGNSLLVLSSQADMTYLVTDYWQPGKEVGIIWNDPDLKINWLIDNPILSPKDEQNLTIKDMFPDRKVK